MTRLRVVGMVAAGVVALASGLAAGCGSSNDSAPAAQAAAPGGGDQVAVLRELAACVRAHGMPSFPDPVIGNDGQARFPDSAPRIAHAAQAPCRSIADRLPSSTAEPVPQAQFQALLAFAHCMRAHGVADWPDPDPDGVFPIDRRLQTLLKSAIRRPLMACNHLNPDPHGRIDARAADS